MPTGDGRSMLRGDGKGAAHRAPPRRAPHVPQRRGMTRPDQQTARRRDTALRRESSGDQTRLIVSTPPDPPAMERNRNKEVGVGGQVPDHVPRRRLRQGCTAAVFQSQRQRARHWPIRDSSMHACMGGRLRKARRATRPNALILIERHMAGGAPGRAEKAQRAPAGGTEAMVVIRDRAAPRASRRQSPGQSRSKKRRQHRANLSRANDLRTRPPHERF